MRVVLLFLVVLFHLEAFTQDCEILTIDQEVQLTENIALVHTRGFFGDSVKVEVLKKWKGDSIPDTFYLLKEDPVSSNYYLDSSKTYMLFWYHGLAIDRCSRSSEYKFVHFEYALDNKYPQAQTKKVLAYDSLKYNKENVFYSNTGVRYDQSKGVYAYYDMESKSILPFEKLPKETSIFYPLRYTEVDSKVETSAVVYDKVFAVYKSRTELEVTNKVKKEVLTSLYEKR